MYSEVRVKNFRCLSDLRASSLQRVNLITGFNNIGKTTLLEALFLQAGPNIPELTLRINAIRGLAQIPFDALQLWGWLFAGKNVDRPIVLENVQGPSAIARLEISLEVRTVTTTTPPPKLDRSTPAAASQAIDSRLSARELKLVYTDSTGRKAVSRAYPGTDGLMPSIRNEQTPIENLPPCVFLSTHAHPVSEDADRFSALAKSGEQQPVLQAMKHLEPRVERLELQLYGGMPVIHGSLLGFKEQMPTPLMGEGVTRLLSMLLAVGSARGGVVLVDEIENGLHHSVLTEVWRSLATAARNYDVQLFATTHSWECVVAAYEAFADATPYDFALLRLDRVRNTVTAFTHDKEAVEGAVKGRIEVR
jgi:hypothetical protein